MSYESDLTDSDWELIEGIVYVGASAKIDRRELINAVFYMKNAFVHFARDSRKIYNFPLRNLKTGCQWRQLPKDFPNWKTVYSFFMRMQKCIRKNHECVSYKI
jgi:putative transposase